MGDVEQNANKQQTNPLASKSVKCALDIKCHQPFLWGSSVNGRVLLSSVTKAAIAYTFVVSGNLSSLTLSSLRKELWLKSLPWSLSFCGSVIAETTHFFFAPQSTYACWWLFSKYSCPLHLQMSTSLLVKSCVKCLFPSSKSLFELPKINEHPHSKHSA